MKSPRVRNGHRHDDKTPASRRIIDTALRAVTGGLVEGPANLPGSGTREPGT
jgi:hypothetical protein